MKQCMLPDCDREVKAKGYCGKHYQRWNRYGDPHIVLPHTRGRSTKARWALKKTLPQDIKDAYGFN